MKLGLKRKRSTRLGTGNYIWFLYCHKFTVLSGSTAKVLEENISGHGLGGW